MSENNQTWDIVLYYKRKVADTPSEPSFNSIQTNNPYLTMDELLDLYSESKKNYQEELSKCNVEDIANKDTISSFIFFPHDDYFIENVKNFEKNSFFIEWSKHTKNIINDMIIKLTEA